jgi:CBS-domain-containing membrane protein
MRVVDVMTTDVLTVSEDSGLKDAARLMINHGISGLPVLDEDGRVVGIITEADFVEAEADRAWSSERRRLLDTVFGERAQRAAETVGDAMTKHPIVTDRDSDITEAARKMSDHGVKRLPVVNPDGQLEGIVSRADILTAFARPDELIVDEIENDVVRRILMLDPDTVEATATEGVVELTGEVPNRSDARLLEALVNRLEGVIKVQSSLTWAVDDTKGPEDRSGRR